ncbi:hypothetical protein CAP42_13680 [Acinetobacter indicus]|uniref:TonB-dependent receptor plug domain-containing protein n=1 Tax=Acinetobacter indicus TaxID=756892 RepID=UPI0005F80387|nr:TonB-dependent receptor plug domain-containing protein [Acinetobacter indicus]KJV44250.1 hypothetical protein VH96_08015 [Acinetobacter indicus]OUY06832.1 hypothetical protein CAP42_13680 [Acinetobacter indicus]
MRFVYSSLSVAILSSFSSLSFAEQIQEPEPTTPSPSLKLSTIMVEAKDENALGKTVYKQEDLKKSPNSSKNITDFLKVNPNVQLGHRFRSSLQQGELNAADISINGGLAYDNKILINGLAINNTINPVGAQQSNHPNQLMGNSQAAAINTDLLCKLTVLDSNVGAEYGEFTGGVISAEACAPQTEIGKIHGSLSYDYTSDAWSKVNFPSQDSRDAFEDSSDESAQPYFTKQGISLNSYGRLSEQWGFNAFASYRHSAIPLKTDFAESRQFEQQRQARNAGVELFYDPSERTSFKLGASFLENDGLYFKSNIRDSESTQNSNSQNLYFNLNNQLDSVLLTQQLNYQRQQAGRQAAQNHYSWLNSSSKNWGKDKYSFEGHMGALNQQESRLEYTIKALFEPIETASLRHQFKIGAGYGHYEAYWQRPETAHVYATPLNLNGADCQSDSDTLYDACDTAPSLDGKYQGQYLSSKTSYYAGQLDIRQDRWHAFIEDQIHWNQYLTATLGFRNDYDSIHKQNNVAPRTALEIRPFGNERLTLLGGWNRYYGLNAFVNELNDRIDQFEQKYTRAQLEQGWTPKTAGKNSFTYRSKLKTPYSDETVLGLSSKLHNTALSLKWVNRDNQDQLRKTKMNLEDLSYSYDNRGRSASDIYSLSIRNLAPLAFLGAQHRLALNADYTETTRHFDHYDSTDILTATPQVYYKRQLIDAEDRPAHEFHVPWTVRLNWEMQFDRLPLTISHFLSYQGKVDALKREAKGYTDAQGVQHDAYTPYTTQNKFYWDLKASYRIPSFKDTQTILGLTINNVTNRANSFIDSSGSAQPDIGRQFIADVTFKF